MTSRHCNHECVCIEYGRNLSISYDPCCVTCEHDTRCRSAMPSELLAPARYLPINLNFQPVCIDKPCIGQIDICPVNDEFDSILQCSEHALWLRNNPNIAEHNKKIILQHDAIIAAQTREDVLNRLDKEIEIRENEMNRKGNLETNYTTASGYLASAGALNWVRKVLIDGSRESLREAKR